MNEILYSIICVSALIMLAITIVIIKIKVVARNYDIVLGATHLYNLGKIHERKYKECHSYYDMKDFDEAVNDIFCWTCKSLVSPEYYREIKPFIPQAKKGLRKK